jgi:hypothetical protein
MVSEARRSDIVDLATAVLGFGPDGAIAYRPGSQLYEVLEPDQDLDELTIEIQGRTSTLTETLAALDAVQLAFDAAVAAVEYRIAFEDDYEAHGEADENTVRFRLAEIPPESLWRLEIVELTSPGSFKGVFRAIRQHPGARRKVLAIAGVASAVLLVVLPPVGAVTTIVVAAAAATSEFVPDPPPPRQFLSSKVDDHLAKEGESDGERERAVKATFDEGFDKLVEFMKQERLESLARDDAFRADIERLKIQVEKSVSPPSPPSG